MDLKIKNQRLRAKLLIHELNIGFVIFIRGCQLKHSVCLLRDQMQSYHLFDGALARLLYVSCDEDNPVQRFVNGQWKLATWNASMACHQPAFRKS